MGVVIAAADDGESSPPTTNVVARIRRVGAPFVAVGRRGVLAAPFVAVLGFIISVFEDERGTNTGVVVREKGGGRVKTQIGRAHV